MGIFKDGYLQVINPNYRGLVGWPVSHSCVNGSDMKEYLNLDDKVLATYVDAETDQFAFLLCLDGPMDADYLKIPQFTPADIPIGELVWVKHINGTWHLIVWTEADKNFRESGATTDTLIVPFIIAETEKEAEKYKDWDEE